MSCQAKKSHKSFICKELYICSDKNTFDVGIKAEKNNFVLIFDKFCSSPDLGIAFGRPVLLK